MIHITTIYIYVWCKLTNDASSSGGDYNHLIACPASTLLNKSLTVFLSHPVSRWLSSPQLDTISLGMRIGGRTKAISGNVGIVMTQIMAGVSATSCDVCV